MGGNTTRQPGSRHLFDNFGDWHRTWRPFPLFSTHHLGDTRRMGAQSTGPVARLRILLGRAIALGPGKADLLEGIRETGSIAAAGRRMNMSYKRAWLLVETMNACFAKPLVHAAKGGKAGGGARLTRLGEEVLARYRRMQTATDRAIARDMAALKKAMRRARR
jgi:molybdate transport system regulatory protein